VAGGGCQHGIVDARVLSNTSNEADSYETGCASPSAARTSPREFDRWIGRIARTQTGPRPIWIDRAARLPSSILLGAFFPDGKLALRLGSGVTVMDVSRTEVKAASLLFADSIEASPACQETLLTMFRQTPKLWPCTLSPSLSDARKSCKHQKQPADNGG
jgi:hypothetical protein